MKVIHSTFMIKLPIILFLLVSVFAAAGSTKLFEPGTSQSYLFRSRVVLEDPLGKKYVGYQIKSDIDVGVVWSNSLDQNEKLLEIELKSPKLLVRSRKTSQQGDFDVHTSKLDKTKTYPFLIHWKNGKIIDAYLDEREDFSLTNIKKGIASLFQILDLDTKETDVSGECNVIYKSLGPRTFVKVKTKCQTSTEFPSQINSNTVLSAQITSSRSTTYKITQDLSFIESISSNERHDLKVLLQKEAGGSVSTTQELILNGKSIKSKLLKSVNLEDALKEFERSREVKVLKQNLELRIFQINCEKEDCPILPKLVKENRQYLSASSLGTHKSANAFIRLLSAGRTSSKENLAKAFKGNKNKEILAQLCDLAGAIQLPEAHEVIMKILNFDDEGDIANSERYLWSLAAGSHPHELVIRGYFNVLFYICLQCLGKADKYPGELFLFFIFIAHIHKISQRPHENEKLSETLILTLAAMTNRFSKIPGNEEHPLLQEITLFILGELEICKSENCKIKYLRALRNLRCPKTIPILIDIALHGKKKTSVEAMKCLRSFEPVFWSEDIVKAVQKIYFQVGRRYDSSSRTLALDILLEWNSPNEVLEELILSLLDHDSMYEVRRYLIQRVQQISEKNKEFSEKINSILRKYSHLLNNYHIQAQRGLTTAFNRQFTSDEYRNGSLQTVLEISKGLLKRGVVDIIMETPEKSTSLFTLGLFANGLSSFVSSDDDKNEAEESDADDVVTAGMELSVLGAQMRPFVFFNSQSELMGHVWSGTASEKSPAYQALILVIDHLEHIPLQNGFVAKAEVLGGISFDLSGQIQISLWNRNAHSLVEKNAGVSLQGGLQIDSSFVKSKVEFNMATELKLNLQSDLNFYSDTSLCMQLSQSEVSIKHNTHKIESIPGGKHRLRKSTYSQVSVQGRSYALNKKNNEMCNLIFNES